MVLQNKLDGFGPALKRMLTARQAWTPKRSGSRGLGVEERALKAGQRAPDFELPDFAGNRVSLAQLCADGPLALIFYRGLW